MHQLPNIQPPAGWHQLALLAEPDPPPIVRVVDARPSTPKPAAWRCPLCGGDLVAVDGETSCGRCGLEVDL